MSLKTKVEKKFPKTKVILTSNNGYGAAMNYGVKKAKTKYVFMSTPDILLNNKILRYLAFDVLLSLFMHINIK